ncbi:putative RNA polymerase, sigma 70 family subunit [Caldicellulosiruptor acetigenus I77R1B]|uniref:Putative RNA polymerase, sigma 70 family subunit n=1 Tax=Caldicellulosiruptor acetigenus (strain ATCC 700853 / DSM 12137 / I77R1B) TaxID=632335 RepID=E4S5B0_CALA7|nr:sigma-70 family RNA polymerase sigma factor [Caldicellulosiruptor acetigenus]ADQ41544.1 putative RNA polymerase, sigma 70 family subunit [Caldicellulosiruptor acetigenus I77R1B]
MFKLSLDEQKELVCRIKQGDKKAAEELIRAYEPLIISIASKYNKPDIFEDLKQEGAVAILQAAQKFDESLGVSFITLAVYYIKRNTDRCVKRSQTIRPPFNKFDAIVPQVISMESVINANSYADDEELKVKDTIQDTINVEEQVVHNEYLKKLVDKLTDEEKKILLLRIKQYSLKEIAEKLGLTEKQVAARVQKIRAKFQCLLKAS